MKRLSKTLAVVLSLAMLISCIPGVVFTANATEATITQPQGVSIVENYDEYVGAEWVAQLGMPAKVTTSDGEADVQWADAAKYVDLTTPGYYFVPGTVNGVAQAVYFPVQVRAYENLASNYHGKGSFENTIAGWAWNDDGPKFVTEPVKDGDYAAQMTIRGARPDGQVHDVIYSYANWNYSNILPPYVTETGAGDYWIGFYMMRGVDSVDAAQTATSITAKMVMQRTTTEVTSGNASFDSTRKITSDEVDVSDAEWTRIGATGYLDGSDKHFDFHLTIWGNGQANDIVYIDNFEIVPLKLALTEVPPIITGVTSQLPAYSVIKNYDAYAGADWQAALGLPAEVDVTLDNGTGKAAVEWDYSTLDLTTTGWYVLNGKLVSEDYANPSELTVKQVIYVHAYSNLFDTYNGSLESVSYWSIRNNQNFTTNPVLHGTYATNQIMPAWNPGVAGDILYSYNKYSAIPADLVTESGAGQYWFGLWAQIGANSVTNAVNDNFQLRVRMQRTTTLVENVISMTENENLVSYDASRTYLSDYVLLNANSYTRVGMVTELDGTDEHLRFYATPLGASNVANDVLHLDNIELVPLKLTLTEVPAIITSVVDPTALSVIKDYDTYVGADWQTALDLPAQVDVKLDDNTTGKADVEWDLSTLNVSELGRYVVTGTVTSEDYILTEELTAEQIIYIRPYSNLLDTYNGSLESVTNWSIRNNQNFTTNPVLHGTYATNQIMPAWNPGVAGDILYSYNKYSAIPADLVTESGAGQYWFGLWGQIGANAQTGNVNDNFQLRVYMKRTTTLVENVASMTENENLVSYDSSRTYFSDYVLLNADSYTRVGMVTELDGTDEHLRFFAAPLGASNVANDVLHLDNIELVPLKVEMPNLVEPTIKDASLALQNNLAIKYTAEVGKFGTDYTAPYVVFTMNGKDTKVEGVVEGDRYVFWFKNIAPHQIGDKITATLHATYAGADFVMDAVDYSVLTYCQNKMGEGNAKLDNLLANLANYNKELALSLNKTPADTSSLNMSAATATDPVMESKLNLEVATVDAPTASFSAATLVLQDAVTIRLFFTTEENIADLKVKITAVSKEWEITDIKTADKANTYYVDFNGLNAAQMREVINATVMKGDAAISNTLAYSVETYAAAKQNTAIGDLVKAMMKYGDSAAAY